MAKKAAKRPKKTMKKAAKRAPKTAARKAPRTAARKAANRAPKKALKRAPKKAPTNAPKAAANMAPYGQYAILQGSNQVGQLFEDSAGEHWYLYTAPGKNQPGTAAYVAPGEATARNSPLDVVYEYVGPVPSSFVPGTYGSTIGVPNRYVEVSSGPGQDTIYQGIVTTAAFMVKPFQIDPQNVAGYLLITDGLKGTPLGAVVCFALPAGGPEEHWFLLSSAAPYTQGGTKTSTQYKWVSVNGAIWFTVNSSGVITFNAGEFHKLVGTAATHTVALCPTKNTYT
jgi:hypothetical protein